MANAETSHACVLVQLDRRCRLQSHVCIDITLRSSQHGLPRSLGHIRGILSAQYCPYGFGQLTNRFLGDSEVRQDCGCQKAAHGRGTETCEILMSMGLAWLSDTTFFANKPPILVQVLGLQDIARFCSS